MKFNKTQYYFYVVLVINLIVLKFASSNEKVLASCGLPISPVAVFPFTGRYGGKEAINHGIQAKLVGVDTITGPNGIQNGGLMLRGHSGSYIEIPNSNGGLLDIKRSITILAFIRPITADFGPVVNYRINGHGVQIWTSGRSNGKGDLTVRFNKRNLQMSQSVLYNMLNLKEWNYIGASYDYSSNAVSLWHDGREVLKTKLQSSASELATQFPVRLGAIGLGLGAYEGGISCLQFYSTALTVEQIKAARDACLSVPPVTSLSVSIIPPSLTLEVNQSITIIGLALNNTKHGLYSFDLGDGTVLTDVGNTADHIYRTLGEYTLVVRATDRCKIGSPIQKVFKVIVTPIASRLYGIALKANITSPGYPAVVQLTFPVASSFECLMEFGDGAKKVISSPRFEAVKTSNLTHIYNKDGFYNISAVCRNRVNTYNATTRISVQYSIQGLTVSAVTSYVRYGYEVEVKWSVLQGSNIRYEVVVNNKTDIIFTKSRDTKSGHVIVTQKHYGSVGRHFVTIVAGNDVTKSVHATRSFEVMHPVPGFNVSVSNTMGYLMVSRPINISIDQATGHGLYKTPLYNIDFGDGSPRLLMKGASVVSHTYSSQKCFVVNIMGFNAVSNESVSTTICIQKAMNPLERLVIQARPARVNDSAVLSLHLKKGSHFVCSIAFSDGVKLTTGEHNSLHVLVNRTFTRPRNYGVIAVCRNAISHATAKSSITIREPIEGFVLFPIQPVAFGQNVTIRWSVTPSTNVTCNVTTMSRNIPYTAEGSRFAAIVTSDMYTEEGVYGVAVTVSNQVTQPLALNEEFIIENLLDGLKIDFTYTLKGIEYNGFGKTKTGFPIGLPVSGKTGLVSQSKYVNYSYLLDSIPMASWENKQTFHLPPMNVGIHNISVSAVNNVSSVNYTAQLFFQERVEFVDRTLLCGSPVVIGDKSKIQLSIGAVPQHTCLFIHVSNDTTYYYGNHNCKLLTTTTVSASRVYVSDIPKFVDLYHTFNREGKISIKVELMNLVSIDTVTCEVDVLLIACSNPVITLPVSRAWSTPRVLKRSESLDIHSEINLFCPSSRGTVFNWKVYKIDEITNKSHDLNYTRLNDDLPSFRIKKRSLSLGLYKVILTVRMSEPELQEFWSEQSGYVRIVASDLVAKIEGGTSLRRGMGPDLKVDGSFSYDPDLGKNNLTGISFLWLCRKAHAVFPPHLANLTKTLNIMQLQSIPVKNSTGSCYTNQSYIINHGLPQFVLRTSQLGLEKYVVKLVIRKGHRLSTSEQTIEIVEGEPPSVDVKCVDNCREKVNPSERIALKAECNGAGCWGKLYYEWTLYLMTSSNTWTPSDYNSSLATSQSSPITIIDRNTLEGGRQYRIEVTARRSIGPRGMATYDFLVNSPPFGGKCDVTPRIGHVLMTKFNFRCSDWKDPDQPLSYQILFSSESDTQTLLYYGNKAEIKEGLPLGLESSNYTLDVEIRVADRLGAKTNVYLKVESLPPHQDGSQVMDEINSMTSGNNSVLDSLRKSGQGQAVALTINTISSLLNVQNTSANVANDDGEMQKKAKIRSKMIESLSEIKSTNMESLAQVTSAMTQATKVKDEVNPQAQVTSANTLSHVGRMLGSDEDNDVGFDTMVTNANSYFSALDNVIGMVSSTAGVGQNSRNSNDTTETGNKNSQKDQAKDSAKSLISSMSSVAKSLLKRKLPQEKATTFVKPGMTASLKSAGINDMNDDDMSLGNGGKFSGSIGQDLMMMKLADNKTALEQEAFAFKDNIYSWDKSSSDITSPVLSLSYSVNGKALDIKGLSQPIQYIMARTQPLPKPEAFILTGPAMINYHHLYVPSSEDSFSIDVMPLNCSNRLTVAVKSKVKPSYTQHDWIKEVHPQNTAQDATRCFSREENVLFLSNTNLSSGVYYIGVNGSEATIVDNGTVGYSIRVYASKCLYWNEKEDKWKGDGCMETFIATVSRQGGPLTNSTHIQCLATHLTSFGSGMFTAPNPIDFSRVFAGFKEAFKTGNVVVLFTVLGLFLVYLLLAIWARHTDNKDNVELTSILIPPINDTYRYTYEVTIVTGSRTYAGTKANVFCDIHGEIGNTGAYQLMIPNGKGFPRRSFKTFVISAPSCLGPITGINIWHDCSGPHSSWFLRKVLLVDSQTNEEWLFAADVWLGLDVGDGQVQTFLKPNTLEDLSGFNVKFSDKIRKEICDKHIWFSLLLRPQWSPFTRLQRLSCCLSFLFTTMIASAMFYGAGPQPGDTSGNFKIGPLTMNIRTIVIAIQSAFVVVPVNIFVVTCFRFAEDKPERLENDKEKVKGCLPTYRCCSCRDGNAHDFCEESTDQDQKYEAKSDKKPTHGQDDVLKAAQKDEKFCENSQKNIDKQKEHDKCDESKESLGYIEGKEGDAGKETNIEEKLESGEKVEEEEEEEKEEEDAKSRCCSCCSSSKSFKLPYWFIYVGWFLCITASLLSGLFVIFYSMMWGKEKSNEWLASLCISFVQDIFVSQPIKILITALLFALVVRRAKDENERVKPRKIETIPFERQPDYNDNNYQSETAPLDKTIIKKLRNQRRKINEIKRVMFDVLYYIVILIMVSILGLKYRSDHTYYIEKTMEAMFVAPESGLNRPGTAEIHDVKTAWDWVNHTLIGGLTDTISRDYNTGLNNIGMIVLNSRLRQLRIKNDSCDVYEPECHVYYTDKHEDKTDYDVRWTKLSLDTSRDSPWQHMTPSEANHTQLDSGIYTDYSGGGYAANLRNNIAGSKWIISQLAELSWIDKWTRAFIAEFDLYSASTNLIISATLLFELPCYGGVVSSLRVKSFEAPESSESIVTAVVETIAFLFLTFMIIRVGMELFLQRCKFFFKLPNIFDILLVTVSMIVVILRMLLKNAQAAQRSHYLESPSSYIDFHQCAVYAETVSTVFALIFFIAVARFAAFLTLFDCIKVFTNTVIRSFEQFGNFLLILVLLIVAYGSFFVLAFADQWDDFKNFSKGTRTLFSFILSNLSGRQLPEPKALALPVVCFYSWTMIFLMLNIFRAILGENHKRAILSSGKKKQENNLSDIAKCMMTVLQEMISKTPTFVPETRTEKSDSERRLESQMKYIMASQSVRINRFLNDLYSDEFHDDLLVMERTKFKSEKTVRNVYV